MKAETQKVMQEALDAAVRRMNSNGGAGASAAAGKEPPAAATPTDRPMDPLGAIMTILPKLLARGDDDSSDEVVEKIDNLAKNEIAPLRAEVLMLRKQCHRLLKINEQLLQSQGQILLALGDLGKQQGLVNGAVADLARQMSRLEIIGDLAGDPAEGDPLEDEAEMQADPGVRTRGEAATSGSQKRAQQKSQRQMGNHGPDSRSGRTR